MADRGGGAAVLVTAFNAEGTIGRCLDSVLAAGEPAEEVIVVLDGCTDRTKELVEVRARRDDRVQIIEMPRIGRGAALNVGLSWVTSPFLAILDADDLSGASRVSVQVAAMSQLPRAVAGLSCRVVAAHADLDEPTEEELTDAIRRVRDVTATLRRGNQLVHSSMLFSTPAVRSVGGYMPTLQGSFDYDLYVRLAEHGYRIHQLDLSMVVASKTTTSFFEGRGAFGYRLGALMRQLAALRTVPGPRSDWFIFIARCAYLFVPRALRARRRLGAVQSGRVGR